MIRLNFLVFCLFIITSTLGQVNYDTPDYFQPGDTLFPSTEKPFFFSSPKKLDIGMKMGTSFGTFNGESLFTSFISPYASYPLSDKFSLEVGSTLSKGNALMTYHPIFGEGFFPLQANLVQTSFYASGRYQLGENLSVFGTGQVRRNIFLSPGTDEDIGSFNTHAMSFGMDYKLGEHASIHFEIQTINSQFPGNDNLPFSTPSSLTKSLVRE